MPQNRSEKLPTYLAATISVASVAPAYKRKTVRQNFGNLYFFQPTTSHSTGLMSCDWLNSRSVESTVDGQNFVALLYARTPVLWKNFK